ncbi:superoxide dismutase family protein [Kitasatospora sp. NPDC059571]|uniref:superoxide dismutase family protein n=1 Tax=Kitasatospora sp. NPDC059571 TaxID=3346871 RepID=UPI00369432BE
MPVPFAAALVPLALLPALAPPTVVDADFDRGGAFVLPTAVSYAPDLVPYGAHVRVMEERTASGTAVTVVLRGAAAGLPLAAHVHTGRCGADPAVAGPHYQDRVDPVQPSTDPAYANDRNEARLALRTDARGSAAARTDLAWSFRPGEARSLVLHTAAPAGTHAAGERIACVSVDF